MRQMSERFSMQANVIVAGSAVFKNDAAANTKEFLKIFEEYSAR